MTAQSLLCRVSQEHSVEVLVPEFFIGNVPSETNGSYLGKEGRSC